MAEERRTQAPQVRLWFAAAVTQTAPAPAAIEVKHGPLPPGDVLPTRISRMGLEADCCRYTSPVGQPYDHHQPFAHTLIPQSGGHWQFVSTETGVIECGSMYEFVPR